MNANPDMSISQQYPLKWRLHLMRALFFLNFISLAIDNWSAVLFPTEQMDVLSGVAISFWAGFSLLNLIGVRFPLKMLPILLLQLLYKSAWIIGTYLPAKISGSIDAGIQDFFWICVAGIILNLLIIPWKYVYREFIQHIFYP
ncbi:MAG: hypothetical protein AAFR87_02775 [Bacteroidota bacterium]